MDKFKDNIINKIKAGDISMRPRWHFVLQTFLLLAGFILAALVAVYILSFVFFTLKKSGLLFAPQFGWHGVMMFIVSSPWLLIGILGIFLLLLYVLVSKYSFSYQKPFVYSIVGVVLSVIALSSFIQYAGVHDRMKSFSEGRNIPFFSPLYKEQANRIPSGVIVGEVLEFSEDRLTIVSIKGDKVFVTVNDRTKISPNLTLKVGEEIMVFGDKKENSLEAFGIRRAEEMREIERPEGSPERPRGDDKKPLPPTE